jgi:hypothetical protein
MTQKSNHLYLLDLLRTLSMLAIITFHANEFIFFTPEFPAQINSYAYLLLENYSRLIPFSGQTIVALTFFLWGWRKKAFSRVIPFFFVFLIGHLLVTLNFYQANYALNNLEWDIYPFLMVSFCVLSLTRKLTLPVKKVLCALSFTFLLVPPDLIKVDSSLNLFDGMLWSTCFMGGSGAWPLFPWLSLPLLFYHGAEIAWTYQEKLKRISPPELFIWLLLLLGAVSSILFIYPLSLFHVNIGAKFYCDIFTLGPLEYWSYFFFPVVIGRLSLVERINSKCSRMKFFHLLKSLKWNSAFGMTYILHIVVLFIGSQWDASYYQNHWFYDLFFLSVIIVPEVLSRSILFLKSAVQKRAHS